MPTAPPHPCANKLCRNLTTKARCEACAKPHDASRFRLYDSKRESSSKRGYDAAWYRFLDGYRRGADIDEADPHWAEKTLARNRCARCGSRRNLEYDHIVPLRAGGARLDAANVNPLCHGCHVSKTREDQRRYAAEDGGGGR